MRAFIAFALLTFLAGLAHAETQTVKGIAWTYTISDGAATIGRSGCTAVPTSTKGAIAIPSSLGGCPVTGIASSAFRNCSLLTSVKIPSSVTSMGYNVFNGCSDALFNTHSYPGVRLVDGWIIDAKASYSGSHAFSGIRGIAPHAFANCEGLVSVALPSKLVCIGEYAFSNCTGLKAVTIPSGVKHLSRHAFQYCTSLRSVTVSKGVESIGYQAFYKCSNVSSVSIPEGVKNIGQSAFANCSKLPSVNIPYSMEYIGFEAFDGCGSLSSASVCTSCELGESAFPYSCSIIWREPLPTTYKIKFVGNGGVTKREKTTVGQTMPYDEGEALRTNTFIRSGYVFIGWAKSKTGAVAYKNAAVVTNLAYRGESVKLYAQWAKKKYKVAFYANGGKGKMAVQKFTYGKSAKLSKNKFKRRGYVFVGWAKKKKGKAVYKNGKTVKNLVTTGKTVKLYAVWRKR